jgi:hypothetical protein
MCIRDTIHRPMIERSETRSPTGSIGTIRSVGSCSDVSTSAGSIFMVFVPPFETRPEIHSVIPPSCHGSLRRTTSMTNFDEVFASSIGQTQPLWIGRGLMARGHLEGSPPRDSTESSSFRVNLRVLSNPTAAHLALVCRFLIRNYSQLTLSKRARGVHILLYNFGHQARVWHIHGLPRHLWKVRRVIPPFAIIVID